MGSSGRNSLASSRSGTPAPDFTMTDIVLYKTLPVHNDLMEVEPHLSYYDRIEQPSTFDKQLYQIVQHVEATVQASRTLDTNELLSIKEAYNHLKSQTTTIRNALL